MKENLLKFDALLDFMRIVFSLRNITFTGVKMKLFFCMHFDYHFIAHLWLFASQMQNAPPKCWFSHTFFSLFLRTVDLHFTAYFNYSTKEQKQFVMQTKSFQRIFVKMVARLQKAWKNLIQNLSRTNFSQFTKQNFLQFFFVVEKQTFDCQQRLIMDEEACKRKGEK